MDSLEQQQFSDNNFNTGENTVQDQNTDAQNGGFEFTPSDTTGTSQEKSFSDTKEPITSSSETTDNEIFDPYFLENKIWTRVGGNHALRGDQYISYKNVLSLILLNEGYYTIKLPIESRGLFIELIRGYKNVFPNMEISQEKITRCLDLLNKGLV